MDFFETVANRRSIRAFTAAEVDPVQITKLLDAARRAPSGTNAQPWKFLVVRDGADRAALREAAYGQRFVGDAPAVIVVLGDRKAFKKRLRRGKELVDLGAIDAETIEKVGAAYREREKNPEWIDRGIAFQCAIAAEHIALAATAEGLGCCWVMLIKADEVARALDLPDHLFPVALMPIGHPAQEPDPRPRYGLEEVAFDGSVNTPWTHKETGA